MIITRLQGGLGNQMFQYAAGLRLALARGTCLKLDLSLLDDPSAVTKRAFALGDFPIRAGLAGPEDLARVAARERSLPRRLARRLGRGAGATERHFHFDPAVLSLPDDSCLRGYWQSERYFADVADSVRRDFTLGPPAGRNAALLEEISACNAVSLHVRRGDYVTHPRVRAMHGTCTLDYYRRATAFVAERVKDPVFFLFSDDPEWTRAHLDLDDAGPARVVDHNAPEQGHEDMRLMSRCAHHVIVNSSFSWWGAWLDPRPEKIVVAPDPWFRDAPHDTRDLLPEGWVRL